MPIAALQRQDSFRRRGNRAIQWVGRWFDL
jgi:hypothetical protein